MTECGIVCVDLPAITDLDFSIGDFCNIYSKRKNKTWSDSHQYQFANLISQVRTGMCLLFQVY